MQTYLCLFVDIFFSCSFLCLKVDIFMSASRHIMHFCFIKRFFCIFFTHSSFSSSKIFYSKYYFSVHRKKQIHFFIPKYCFLKFWTARLFTSQGLFIVQKIHVISIRFFQFISNYIPGMLLSYFNFFLCHFMEWL